MTKIAYITKRFNGKAKVTIAQAIEIIDAFREQGFTLTLRQLYYQFVGRALIPNTLKSYKRLGSIVSEARLAGLIDWEAIEDRTRFVRQRAHWNNPAGVIASAAFSYGKDLWEGQQRRVEVWIEKDALVGVFEKTCTAWDVPLFSCRGYSSQSELWRAANRMIAHECPVTVLHLGDHDPSGMDMTRDIEERLRLFGADVEIKRLALNMAQVKKHKLPPNPAKTTDSRFKQYEEEHGGDSWELDAMDPKKLVEILEKGILEIVDQDEFDICKDAQETDRDLLQKASNNWTKIAKILRRRAR